MVVNNAWIMMPIMVPSTIFTLSSISYRNFNIFFEDLSVN